MERSNNEIIKSLNKIRTELQCMKGVENELASTLKDISESLGNAENSMNHLFTTLKRGYDGIEDCLQGMIDQTDYLLDLIVKGQLDVNRHDIDNLKELLEDELDKVKGGNESLGNIRDFIGTIDNTVLPNLGLSSNYTAPFAAGVECVLNGIDTLKSELNGQLDEANDRTEDPNNIYSQTKVKVNNETLTENDAIQSLDLELSDIQAIRVHVDELESLLLEILRVENLIHKDTTSIDGKMSVVITRLETLNTSLNTGINAILTRVDNVLTELKDPGSSRPGQVLLNGESQTFTDTKSLAFQVASGSATVEIDGVTVVYPIEEMVFGADYGNLGKGHSVTITADGKTIVTYTTHETID